jgi:hypothetical protein
MLQRMTLVLNANAALQMRLLPLRLMLVCCRAQAHSAVTAVAETALLQSAR